MKTKYIIFIILIAVYFLIANNDKKAAGEYYVYEAGLAEGMVMGGAGAAGEKISRKKLSAPKFKSTTNILFNGWVILAVIGIAVYMMGGLDFILQNPTLLLFGLLSFGVMALMK